MLGVFRKKEIDTSVPTVVKLDSQVSDNASLPLDIYEDLPNIGEDRQELLEMIQKAFPEAGYIPQQIVRANRRKLYMSIHFLRTDSKRQWAYDVSVAKGQYTTDRLIRVAAARQVSMH